jgi:hypothetical protein
MVQRLHNFSLDECIYTLGKYSPVSIRDQVIRANYLIDSLRDLEAINSNTSLAIVGAGAGGISCALAAMRAGLSQDAVSVFEAEKFSMPLQAKASTRWIDPVQYDWPARFWDCERWPVPLTNTSVHRPTATMIAALGPEWAFDFQNELEGSGVVPYYEHEVVDYKQLGDARVQLDVIDKKSSKRTTSQYDVLVLAAGFGGEISQLDVDGGGAFFQGIGFWGNDKFETVTKGLDKEGKVLVSGSGDGALQDFVRLVCGVKSVRELMLRIWVGTSAHAKWKEEFLGLWHWELNARNSRNFLTKHYNECQLLAHLHERYQEPVNGLAVSSDWVAVCDVLDKLTQNGARANVDLLTKCTHFAWCYPLNRIAVLLIIKYLEARNVGVLRQSTALMSTRAEEHAKCEDGCWGKKHAVRFALNTSCKDSGADIRAWKDLAKPTKEGAYLGLVVRHGIRVADSKFARGAELVNQVLPMHLP